VTTHNFTGTATDTLGAAATDTLAFTSTGSAAQRVVRRSLFANRINWDSAVANSVQGPTFSDVTPQSTSITDGVACPPGQLTVSQIFSVLIPCRVTGFRIYKAPNAVGTSMAVTLWSGVSSGTSLATTTIPSWTVDGGGWRQVTFTTPVDLTVGTTYTIGVHITSGIYAYSEWVFNGQDAVVWPIVAKTLFDTGVKSDGNASGGPGVATITFPTTHQATNFYIDPQVEWDDPMPGYLGGTAYFDQWTNPTSSHAFPVAVFFADPPFLAGYYALGVNTLVGGSVNPDYVAAHNAMGNTMDWWPYIDPLDDNLLRVQDEEPAIAAQIRGYQLDDEPDMSTGNYRSPALLQTWVNYMRGRDSTKPLYLNFGIPPPVNQGFFHAPSGSSIQTANELWRQWASMADIISCDQYNLADGTDPSHRYGVWVYAAQIGRMREICDDTKPVWLVVETTSQTPSQPTPTQVRQAVWAALIAGARGVVFFDHRFGSDFVTQDFAAMLSDSAMSTMVTALTAQLQTLGVALMSPDLGLVTATTSSNTTAGPKGGTYGVPIHYTTRADGAHHYLFAQAIRPGATTATITVPSWAGATLTVIGESRTVTASGAGVITDTFAADYTYHLYQKTP
jgi:hypothetical protein